jgi:hypothetical protein
MVRTLESYAKLLRKIKQKEEAEVLEEQAKAIRTKTSS